MLACAGSREIIDFPSAKISKEALLDTLANRDALLTGILGRMSVEVESPTVSASFDADYYFTSPDSFRANIRGLLGTTPGAIVSIADSVAAYFPGSGTLFVAVGEPDSENPVLGLSIQFGDIVSAMIGIFAPEDGDSLVGFSNNDNLYELLFDRGDFIRLGVLPTLWVVSSKQIYNTDGTALIDIGYDGFTERAGIVRPSQIILTSPMRGEKITIHIEKEYIGRELPEGTFDIEVREDVIVWNLL